MKESSRSSTVDSSSEETASLLHTPLSSKDSRECRNSMSPASSRNRSPMSDKTSPSTSQNKKKANERLKRQPSIDSDNSDKAKSSFRLVTSIPPFQNESCPSFAFVSLLWRFHNPIFSFPEDPSLNLYHHRGRLPLLLYHQLPPPQVDLLGHPKSQSGLTMDLCLGMYQRLQYFILLRKSSKIRMHSLRKFDLLLRNMDSVALLPPVTLR